jgi:hypothetical protein
MSTLTETVVSSVNVPTIPLAVAQAMNPAPRPPSPIARAATQRPMRRENTKQLFIRDAEILTSMAPPSSPSFEGGNRPRSKSSLNELEAEVSITPPTKPRLQVPPVRPPQEMRRQAPTSEVRVLNSVPLVCIYIRIFQSSHFSAIIASIRRAGPYRVG